MSKYEDEMDMCDSVTDSLAYKRSRCLSSEEHVELDAIIELLIECSKDIELLEERWG